MAEFVLSHTQITDAVVIPLHKQLRGDISVDVSRTAITSQGLAQLATQSNAGRLSWTVEKGKFNDQELNNLRSSGIRVTEKE